MRLTSHIFGIKSMCLISYIVGINLILLIPLIVGSTILVNASYEYIHSSYCSKYLKEHYMLLHFIIWVSRDPMRFFTRLMDIIQVQTFVLPIISNNTYCKLFIKWYC